MIFSIFPLLLIVLLIAAIVLIVLGLRGKPVFDSPKCAKCGYDLRAMNFMSGNVGTCPECGANLSADRAVNFARLKRQSKLIWVGVALLVLPFVLLFGVRTIRVGGAATVAGPAALRTQTTAAVIATLPAAWNQPWAWQELERRLGAGSLTTQDVDAALAALTTSLRNTPAGQHQPLHWADSFLKRAQQNNLTSKAAVQSLCEAFYSAAPSVTVRPTQRQGGVIGLFIDTDTHWDLPNMRSVWALNQVRTGDGTVLPAATSGQPPNPDGLSGSRHSARVSAQLTQSLPPGQHELTFVFDLGTVDEQAILRGMQGRPGRKEKWPAPIAAWQIQIKQNITIVDKDAAVISVVNDPAQGELPGVTIDARALARPARRGSELVLKWNLTGKPSVPVCYNVEVQAGEQRLPFGTLMFASTSRGETRSYTENKEIPNLPPEVKSIDLIFTPDPKAAEQFDNLSQIWGKEWRLKDVPLDRSDLEAK